MSHKLIGCFKTYEEYRDHLRLCHYRLMPDLEDMDENKQYDVEAGEFIDESIQEGEELKDYPEEDPMDIYHAWTDLEDINNGIK